MLIERVLVATTSDLYRKQDSSNFTSLAMTPSFFPRSKTLFKNARRATPLCNVAVGYRMRTNPPEHIIYFFGCMEFYQSKLDLKAKVHFYKIRDENCKLEMEAEEIPHNNMSWSCYTVYSMERNFT